MPNILSACPEEMLDRVDRFPLKVKLCTNCFLGYNVSKLTDEQLSFIYDNYLYIAPMRGIGASKYSGMLETIKKHTDPDDHIVEIGCADGYLLSRLQESGYSNLMGIDPCPPDESDVNIVKCYFDEKSDVSADHFVLMHVLEHLGDPFSVIKHVASLARGKIFIEIPNFCAFHHQHLSYFNVPFLQRMCRDYGLDIISLVQRADIMELVLARGEGIIDTAKKLGGSLENTKSRIEKFIGNADKVYWWGAGSVSVEYLNIFKTGKEIIVIDGDNEKWGFYIPGVNLKVYPASIIYGKEIDHLVIASMFRGEIEAEMKRENAHANNILYLEG